MGPRYSVVTVDLQQRKIFVNTRKAGRKWHRRRKIQIPNLELNLEALKPITFSVINDIHYGPQRWDLYDEPEIAGLLDQFIKETNRQDSEFVVVNGDWIDGHM
mgnify:FL=1